MLQDINYYIKKLKQKSFVVVGVRYINHNNNMSPIIIIIARIFYIW